jgi:undecaprenyl phosphate N,N'-diacetylbacillosamine 1-phosphate transferase
VDKKKLVMVAAAGAAAIISIHMTGKCIRKSMRRKNSIVVIPHKQGFYEKYVKRPMDVCCASVALVVLSPVMAVTAVLIRIKLGSPVIFTQERPGLNGEIFKLYKFRTMTDARDKNGKLLLDAERLTKFGSWIRSLSIDELPELWNILRGDIAICGPRPLLKSYLPIYNEHQVRRHEVMPGLTGYAQVHGRNSISWEEKFDMDVWYVDHVSFWTDVKIILDTVKTVLSRDGIHSETSATMEYFTGTPETEKIDNQ